MHSPRVPSQDEVLQTFRRAGYPSLTPVQKKLIPLMLKGRDILAEAPEGSGTSAAIIAPLVLGLRGAGPSLRALVLLPAADDVSKLAQVHARFARVVRDAPAFVPLGEVEDARREQRRLERDSTIVAGTAGRVIDHIRRGTISFASLETVIVREPEADARADFAKDVQFIFAKWSARPRVVLLARASLPPDDELAALLHHPLTMDVAQGELTAPVSGALAAPVSGARAAPASGARPAAASGSHAAVLRGGLTPAESLARVALGLRLPPLVAFHGPRTEARGIADTLRARGLRALVLPPAGRQNAERRAALAAFSRGALDVLLVPLAGASARDLEEAAPRQVVFLDLPTGPVRSPGGMLKRASIIALGEREKDFGKLQEAIGVAFQRIEVPGDDALLTGAIDRALKRMKEEDKTELAELRARIRRQVPLFARPLFMASLLKALLPARAPRPVERPAERTGGERAPAERAGAERTGPARGRASAPAPGPSAQVPPRGQRGRFGRSVENAARPERPSAAGDSAQLFVSVGRNRRVYARELTELFMDKLQLAEGDIRDVRVFDKYSFVDIAPSRAEDAISRLSGVEVKGRPITVNYAKKKEEKETK